MTFKKILSIIFVVLMVAGCALSLTGCGPKKPEVSSSVKNDTEHTIGYQLEMPADGEEIAIIHTSMGDIGLRLFPENAPMAVENFIALAKSGKYNGNIFHRVINDFMLQTGDYENADGTGGKPATGDEFADEFCNTLYNIRGSVAMANGGENTNRSQFFINQAKPESFDRNNYDYNTLYNNYINEYNQLVASYGFQFADMYKNADAYINDYAGGISPLSYAVPEEVWALYEANGGNISLDGALRAKGGHTVFAQVFNGMDVVDAIAAVEVDENNKPKSDIIITSIEILPYKAN